MKKLLLDDIREVDWTYTCPRPNEFDVVRNYHDFVEYIKARGLLDFISFDNELGLDDSKEVASDGYGAAKWLVYGSGLDLKNLEFKVHSANPVATEQIKGLLNNYIKFLKED